MDRLISQVVSVALPDIDTDVIIPAQFLTTTTKVGLGEHLFQRIKEGDPSFPLNKKKYAEAKVLITGANFGCGSSREHAAWALYDYGFRVVIASSFADIFYSNALKNKILPIVLPQTVVQQMIKDEKESEHYVVEVALFEQSLFLPDGKSFTFEIDPFRKECLLQDMDDLDYLNSKKEAIASYMKKHPPLYDLSAITVHKPQEEECITE